MKNRLLLILSILIFCCLNAVGQKNNKYIKDSDLQPIHDAIANLQDSLQYYQEQNLLLVKQMNDSKKEVISISEDYLIKYEDLKYSINLWLVFVSIIMTVIGGFLGVILPIHFNNRNEKQMEKMLSDAKEEASNAIKQAEEAATALIIIKKDVSDASSKAIQAINKTDNTRVAISNIKTKTDTAANKAENAAKNTQAIQFFIQALQEYNPNTAIELYTNCIKENRNFAEAYNNRGYLRYRLELNGAMRDFDDAINKKDNYYEAYNNRGLLRFKNNDLDGAMEDFDKAIKGEYYEAYLNRGLLKFAKDDNEEHKSNAKKSDLDGAKEDFERATNLMTNKADAFYIMGLYNYCSGDEGAKDIIKAKEYRHGVIDEYPNRNLLNGEMKIWDNSFYKVEYSRYMTKLIRVPENKEGYFRIPYEITKIEDSAFCDCEKILKIDLSQNTTEIGEGAFKRCTSLSSILIPFGVTEIKDSTFSGCTSLKAVEIPSGVITIGNNAFSGCTSLNAVEIPSGVITIGDSAFSGCKNVTMYFVDKRNPNYRTIKGALYTKDNTTLVRAICNIINFVIPNRVRIIDGYAFSDCTLLSSIKFPSNINEIRDGAFSGCISLTSIKIPSRITRIGDWTFSGCISLTSINIPNNVTMIGDWAFSGCTSLTSIDIPSSVTKIEDQAFVGCSKVVELHLRHFVPMDFSNAFDKLDITNINLYVPLGSRATYQAHKFYCQFKNVNEE